MEQKQHVEGGYKKMKIVHLNEARFESLFNIIEENTDNYIPFQTFYEDAIEYIKGLLNKPFDTKISAAMSSMGINDGEFRNKLLDNGIMTKKSDIREPYDEESGKPTSRYYESYKLKTDNLKSKLREIYNELTKAHAKPTANISPDVEINAKEISVPNGKITFNVESE